MYLNVDSKRDILFDRPYTLYQIIVFSVQASGIRLSANKHNYSKLFRMGNIRYIHRNCSNNTD